jgi:hypothetical protein
MLATVDLKIKHFEKKKQLLFFKMLDALCELLLLDKGYASKDEDRDAMVLLLVSGYSTTLGKHLQMTAANMATKFEQVFLHHDKLSCNIVAITLVSCGQVQPLIPDLRNF